MLEKLVDDFYFVKSDVSTLKDDMTTVKAEFVAMKSSNQKVHARIEEEFNNLREHLKLPQ